MIIRHADPARDGAACAEIYGRYVADTAISFEEQPPTADEMTRRIERISERYPWLVADEDGVACGFAYGSVHRERAAYRWTAEVTVYVAEGRQRLGIGRGLYRTLLELLTRQGVQMAVGGITLPNDASVALHEALGFKRIGVYPRIGWKLGRWHDVGWWGLELAPPTGDPPPEVGPPARLP